MECGVKIRPALGRIGQVKALEEFIFSSSKQVLEPLFIISNFSMSVEFLFIWFTLNLDLLYDRVYAKKVRCKTEVVLILDTIISL